MSDVTYVGSIDLPFTDKTAELVPAPLFQKLKKVVAFILSGALLGAIAWGIGWAFDLGWLQTTGYVLGGLVAAMGIFMGLTAQEADCPYCGHRLGTGVFDTLQKGDEDAQIECGNCFEWLLSNQGTVRAFLEADVGDKTVDAPVCEGGSWPDECIACGAPAVRTEEASSNKFNAGALLVGSLSVSSGSVRGIPYCGEHGDAVSLAIRDDHLRVEFTDYAARRRYVSVNRGREPISVD